MKTTENIVVHLFEEVATKRPFWQYFKIFRDEPYAYFLDSSLAENSLGHYSFMGAHPYLIYKAVLQDDGEVNVEQQLATFPGDIQQSVSYQPEDLFEDLRLTFDKHKLGPEIFNDERVPFHAGAVGFLGYEAGSLIEQIPVPKDSEVDLPVACFLFVDYTFCFCHTTQKAYLSIIGRGSSNEEAHQKAEAIKASLTGEISIVDQSASDQQIQHKEGKDASSLDFVAQHDRQSYTNAVRQIKQHIYEGSVYEVCLTHRYSCKQEKDTWALYQTLRAINPAPFSSYLKLPELDVVCSSPERFLRLDRDGMIESRPIKGTRRRGETQQEDEVLRHDLATSEKDRAENLMIVDLVRNDLSRVSEIGSVHVPQLLEVEQYATVLQLVSAIKGKLKEEYDAFDLIRACFPGGSMTGAPKIEAMKIIASLEKSKRGIYSGAIGYIDATGTLDLNIVIRSIVVTGGQCYLNVGGAIVSDSNPDAEYEETLDKARVLVAALRA